MFTARYRPIKCGGHQIEAAAGYAAAGAAGKRLIGAVRFASPGITADSISPLAGKPGLFPAMSSIADQPREQAG